MQSRGYIVGAGMENDTFTCSHCQKIIVVKPPKGAASHHVPTCAQCYRKICGPCVTRLVNGKCVPWEKFMDRYEKRAAQTKQFMKALKEEV